MTMMLVRVVLLVLLQPVLGEVTTQFGCEGSSVRLECGQDVISLVRANWGRFSISVCNHLAKADLDTSCSSEAATTAFLARRCQGLSSCQLEVEQEGLPLVCPGTEKYLEVRGNISLTYLYWPAG